MADPVDNKGKIVAQAFDAPGSVSQDVTNESQPPLSHARLETKSVHRWWHSQFNLMLAVFGLLAVAALIFVSLSPAPSNQSQNVTLVKQDGSVNEQAASATANPTEAPWDEKRRAQARTDSQTILATLLSNKKTLEAKGVEEWAPEEYKQALELAALGDEFYKQQDYQPAIENYQSAASQMEALHEKLPAIIETNIKEGFAAIEEGKSGLAAQKFNKALTLDQNSIPALKGLGRAENLDKVLGLYAKGQEYEQRFGGDDKLENLTLAEKQYQDASTLDNDFLLAKQGIGRVRTLTQDKRFRQFMSKGFKYLFAKRYSSARKEFSSALKIKPNDAAAKGAFSQSLASNRSASLSSVISAAKNQESSEQWSQALASYQAVLQRDPNQVSAKLGQIRSKVRGELDARIEEILSDPLSLSKTSAKEKANNVLRDARGITSKGPRLQQQISQLESALGQLNQSIKFVFSSDEKTQISLLKAGSKKIDLGLFKTKNLVLKPGRYVVKGVRVGYQDVRKEIDVLPGTLDVQSVLIRCTEPVSGSVRVNDRNEIRVFGPIDKLDENQA